MQPLVDEFGSKNVYWAGLKALGYPPTWAHSVKEALAVQHQLRPQQEE